MCVWEREREGESEKESDRKLEGVYAGESMRGRECKRAHERKEEREREERESVCVCVCDKE